MTGQQNPTNSELDRLVQLKESGALTEEEYQAAKSLVLKKEDVAKTKRALAFGLLALLALGASIKAGWATGSYFFRKAEETRIIANEAANKATEKFLSSIGKATAREVAQLIQAGADVNAKNQYGDTALIEAVRFNFNLDVITALIEASADVNAEDKDGSTALMLAKAKNSNPDVITALLNAGAKENKKSNVTDAPSNTPSVIPFKSKSGYVTAPEDSKLTRGFITGSNVNLRLSPSMNGRVDSQATHQAFIIESTPIRSNDKSEWYKILFKIDELDDGLWQIHPELYVNSRFVKKESLTQYDKSELAWFREGRLPKLQVGEEVSGSSYTTQYVNVPYILQKDLTLLDAPDTEANSLTIPKGTSILWLDKDAAGDGLIDEHQDMQDNIWHPLVGASDKKLLGWVKGWNFSDSFNPFGEGFISEPLNEEKSPSTAAQSSSGYSSSYSSNSNSGRLTRTSTLGAWNRASRSEQIELCKSIIRSSRGSLKSYVSDSAYFAGELWDGLTVVASENPQERIDETAMMLMVLMDWYE